MRARSRFGARRARAVESRQPAGEHARCIRENIGLLDPQATQGASAGMQPILPQRNEVRFRHAERRLKRGVNGTRIYGKGLRTVFPQSMFADVRHEANKQRRIRSDRILVAIKTLSALHKCIDTTKTKCN